MFNAQRTHQQQHLNQSTCLLITRRGGRRRRQTGTTLSINTLRTRLRSSSNINSIRQHRNRSSFELLLPAQRRQICSRRVQITTTTTNSGSSSNNIIINNDCAGDDDYVTKNERTKLQRTTKTAAMATYQNQTHNNTLDDADSFMRAFVAIPGCIKYKPLRYISSQQQRQRKFVLVNSQKTTTTTGNKSTANDGDQNIDYNFDGIEKGSTATLTDHQMDVGSSNEIISSSTLSTEEQERKLRQTEAKNIVARRLQNARNDRIHLTKPYAVVRLDRANNDEDRAPYKQVMSRRQMLRDTDLSPRDLRRIDPVLTQSINTAAIIVREDSILVNLGVRVIIREDHALLLGPDSGPSNNFLEAWNQKIAAQKMLKGVSPNGASNEGPTSVDGGVGFKTYSSSSQQQLQQQDSSEGLEIPFELQVLEAALQETVHQLEERLETVTRRYRALERKMQLNINKETLDELRFMKQTLVQLESRAETVRDVLLDTLNDEDDIERMTLSSKAKKENEEDAEQIEFEEEEVENLIEYYLQQAESCHSGAEALLENARDLDESVASTLAARRLEVSKLELTLSIASFSAAIGAVITGIFGMNLRSCLEMSISAFYITCGLLLVGLKYSSIAIIRWARRKGVL